MSPATVTPPEPATAPTPVKPTKTEVNGKEKEKNSKRKSEGVVTVSSLTRRAFFQHKLTSAFSCSER